MIPLPPLCTRTDSPLLYATLFRSPGRSGPARRSAPRHGGAQHGAEQNSGRGARGVGGEVEPVAYPPLDEKLPQFQSAAPDGQPGEDRSEEHTPELQSLMRISYAVFCLKKKKKDIVHLKHTTI